jgi:hypothetical protein
MSFSAFDSLISSLHDQGIARGHFRIGFRGVSHGETCSSVDPNPLAIGIPESSVGEHERVLVIA